ncbi:MAG TPA: hypothetical protein VJ521_13930 [Acidobacteriota bacterium]|nr:hypothetical protein [Acidobacteriota bacterium]
MTKKILFLLPALVLWQTTICARICPYSFLPKDWVQSYQEGKEWTKLLLKVYAASFSEPEKETDSDTNPGSASTVTTPAGAPMTRSVVHATEVMAHTLTILEDIDPCPETVVSVPSRQRIAARIVRKAT